MVRGKSSPGKGRENGTGRYRGFYVGGGRGVQDERRCLLSTSHKNRAFRRSRKKT